MKYLHLIGLGFVLLISCNNNNANQHTESKDTNTNNNPVANEVNAPATNEPKEENWNAFWSSFTNAIKKDNVAKLKEVCYIPTLGNDFMSNDFNNIFEGDTKNELLHVPSKDITPSDTKSFEGLENPQDVMEVYLENSNYFLYFAKVEGKYKLVYLLAAG